MTSNDFSDRDIDRLLRGEASGDLADTAPSIDALRALSVAPTEEEAARAGAALASVAAAAAQAPAPQAAPARRTWKVRAAVAGALSLAIAGFAGTAASADDAAPGDALYSLDRALEGLGLFDGGLEERIQEALKLDASGEIEAALEHVAQALAALDETTESTDESTEEAAEDEATESTDESTEEATEDEATESTDESTEEATEDEATESTDESTEETTEDEATETTKNKEACDALLAAAAKIRENGSEASADVHARVSEMLTWMATTDARGRDFGHGVSMRAHGIYDEDGVLVAKSKKDKSWKDGDESADTDDAADETTDVVVADDESTTEDDAATTDARKPAKETDRTSTEDERAKGSDKSSEKDSWSKGSGKNDGDRDGKRGSGSGFSKSGGNGGHSFSGGRSGGDR